MTSCFCLVSSSQAETGGKMAAAFMENSGRGGLSV